MDRTKDLIKSGGEWISSVEIENELMSHPKIKEAAVIGVFRDTITDFQVGIDILQFNATALALLDGIVFDADGFGEGEQGDNFLVVGNGAVADQAYAQMLFDMTTGVLSIDADGTGESEAVFIGTIGAGLSLTANDFLFVIPEA